MTLYLIRYDGKWLAGGYRNWSDDPTKAKVYSKLGLARNRLAFFPGAEIYALQTSEPVLLETESQLAADRRMKREDKRKVEKLHHLQRTLKETQGRIRLEQERLQRQADALRDQDPQGAVP